MYYVHGIHIRRVYDPPTPNDGARLLVDRLWPRGVTWEKLQLAGWLKGVAPSDSLRHWFNHDSAKWEEFQRRYAAELEQNPRAWQPILQAACDGIVTLLFAARDTRHNNAAALRTFLEKKLAGPGVKTASVSRSGPG
ncbi:MAG TPA: DUF488 family protein [Candidatus Paceibacterota bacterium]|nr:DUF488 family protein [Candidatus Paceibacterota bacterium]